MFSWRGWRKRREKPSIILVAGGSYALLVGISMAVIVALMSRANFENTFALLNDKAVLTTPLAGKRPAGAPRSRCCRRGSAAEAFRGNRDTA